jgi:hypothetical protein
MGIFDGLKQFLFGDDDDEYEIVESSDDGESTEGEPYNDEIEPDVADGGSPNQGEPEYVQMQETNREDPSGEKGFWGRLFGLN